MKRRPLRLTENAELTCNHSVDTFIQQRHRRGTEGGGQEAGSRKQRQASPLILTRASEQTGRISGTEGVLSPVD